MIIMWCAIALIGRRVRMKKFIIIIVAVLLTVGTGLVVPLIINSQKDDPKTQVTDVKNIGTQPSISEAVNTPAYDSAKQSEATKPMDSISTNAIKQPDKSGVDNTYTPNPMKEPVQTQATSINNYQTSTPVPTDVQEQPLNWVEAQIQKYRDEIDDGDLADFRRIYQKVDITYIQSISQAGYTEEEIQELKTYLRNTLGGDYERAKELFYKYDYLLSVE